MFKCNFSGQTWKTWQHLDLQLSYDLTLSWLKKTLKPYFMYFSFKIPNSRWNDCMHSLHLSLSSFLPLSHSQPVNKNDKIMSRVSNEASAMTSAVTLGSPRHAAGKRKRSRISLHLNLSKPPKTPHAEIVNERRSAHGWNLHLKRKCYWSILDRRGETVVYSDFRRISICVWGQCCGADHQNRIEITSVNPECRITKIRAFEAYKEQGSSYKNQG